jgi:hypothetical protein
VRDKGAVDTPLVGFRCWVLPGERPVLRSMAHSFEWPSGQLAAAVCDLHQDRPPDWTMHAAPEESCRCGLYARTTLEGCTEEYPYYPLHECLSDPSSSGLMTMGAVLMWGTILRGRRVIRSQYAQVLCLTDTPAASWGHQLRRRRLQKKVEAICREYRVPLILYHAVTQYAAEFGELAGEAMTAA